MLMGEVAGPEEKSRLEKNPKDSSKRTATENVASKNLMEIMTGISLYTHLSHFGICLRSSVKEITAINISILLVGLLHSVSWYRENYPGLVLVLSDMTRLWRRRSRKKGPILIPRTKASQRERKDLRSDQNDLKSDMAEKIANEYTSVAQNHFNTDGSIL